MYISSKTTDETVLCSSRPEFVGVREHEQGRSGLLPTHAAGHRAGIGYALGEGAKRRASETVGGSRLITMWSFQSRFLLAILQSRRLPCSLLKSQEAYNIHPRNTPQPSSTLLSFSLAPCPLFVVELFNLLVRRPRGLLALATSHVRRHLSLQRRVGLSGFNDRGPRGRA